MTMKNNGEIIVDSIGVCAAFSGDPSKEARAVVAYSTANAERSVYFVVMNCQLSKPCVADDFLGAIARAEGVKNVVYSDDKGRRKDVFLCREQAGKVFDIAKRDANTNSYEDGIAEIAVGFPRFGVSVGLDRVKSYTKLDIDVNTVNIAKYARNSMENAVVNAYNACLLGRAFGKEELTLETKEKRKVKIEVRTVTPYAVNGNVLYVKPVSLDSDGYIDYYLSEEFNFIDGEKAVRRQYKIVYADRLRDYYVSRV